MAWNVFKIDSSKIGFHQNFLIYCDTLDNKIIHCLSHLIAGNFSSAPTSSLDARAAGFYRRSVKEKILRKFEYLPLLQIEQ